MAASAPKLLSRSVFRELTLARAGGRCCVPTCALPAVDAHHILNRNLFTAPEQEGGYFLSNGAQLCSQHHYEAELTKLSVEDLRSWCGVELLLPLGWDTAKSYDCWGNEILPDGFRLPGPLFSDRGFQKLLKLSGLTWRFIR